MPKILIIYSSTDGQTKRICERIKMNSVYNSDTKIISINDASSESIIPYDNIVIGASIRYGKHNAKVYEFIKKNKKELQEKRKIEAEAAKKKATAKKTKTTETTKS